MNDEEQKDITKQAPDYEWDLTINCNQNSNTIIKLISGGSVCIIKAGQLFRNAMITKTYEDKILALQEENRQGWETRIKLDKLVLQQLEIIRKYEQMTSEKNAKGE